MNELEKLTNVQVEYIMTMLAREYDALINEEDVCRYGGARMEPAKLVKLEMLNSIILTIHGV